MVVAFTGAGISRSSGVPTFQEMPRVRDKLTREFATLHPTEYRKVMEQFVDVVSRAEPTRAHKALNYFNVPIITMNIDGLHQKAGSKIVIPVHGRLPREDELQECHKLKNTPVLYGDEAPMYKVAFDFVRDYMQLGDTLLVIGASDYTMFSTQIRLEAMAAGADVVEIQDHADEKVWKFLDRRADGVGFFGERFSN